MSYAIQDSEENDHVRAAAFRVPDTRWSLSQCEHVLSYGGGEVALRTWGVPMDYSGMRKLRDVVPYSAKKLESLTRKFCSASPEFAPRTKSVARFADQDTKQRFPTGGPQRTRQSPCMPFESGDNVLPGMESFYKRNILK